MNQNDECNYFDANSQNASDMNLNCVNNRINGVDKYCKSEYKLYDNISRNSQYLQIKRDTDAGYNVQNTTPQIKKTNLNSGIEGFTGKIFITDNGPGKTNIKGICPEGFKWNETLGGCIQVCRNCHYNEINEHKSKDYNKADPCFPEGVYDGISNSGILNCTCGKDNKYCSDNFIKDIYEVIGLL